ncbi:ComEC family competence protein [Puteibacter caeruleilacunae]|nr:ComEC family competence protein [Puteibacter caeruleilacunae]
MYSNNNFIETTPFLRILVPFIVGILIYNQSSVNISFSVLIPIFTLCLISAIFSYRIKHPNQAIIFGIFISFVFLMIGYCNTKWCIESNSPTPAGTSENFIGYTLDTPQKKKNSFKVRLQLESPQHERIIAYLQNDSSGLSLPTGSVIAFQQSPQPIVNQGNPGEFNYAAYCRQHYINQQVFLSPSQWIKLNRQTHSLTTFASQLQNNIKHHLTQTNIHPTNQQLILALIVGNKDQLDPEIKHHFKAAGAMHLMAVSGLHVGIVYLILSSGLFFLKYNRVTRVVQGLLTLTGLWGFALLTGLTPSVTRATLLFTLVLLAKTIHRNANLLNTLLLTAFLILLINPMNLYDVGFQLSFTAVFGIMLFYKPIYSFVKTKYLISNYLLKIMAVSIGAQLGTLPFTLYYFHQYPPYSVISSIFLIPFVGILIPCAIITVAFSLTPFFHPLIGHTMNMLMKIFITPMQYIESLPYALIEHIRPTLTQCVILILLILFLGLLFHSVSFANISGVLLCTLLLLCSSIYVSYKHLTQHTCIIYNNYPLMLHLIDNNNQLYIDKQDSVSKSDIPYYAQAANELYSTQSSFTQVQSFSDLSNGYTCWHGTSIKIWDDQELKHKIPDKPLTVNILLIKSIYNLDPGLLLKYYNPQTVVFSSTIHSKGHEKLEKFLKSHFIVYHNVKSSGAFVLNTNCNKLKQLPLKNR